MFLDKLKNLLLEMLTSTDPAAIKETVRYIALALNSFAVIGFGLAVFQSQYVAFYWGFISLFIGILLVWRSYK